MKKMTKRVISIFLSVLMLISAVPAFSLTAFAEGEAEAKQWLVENAATATAKTGTAVPYFTSTDVSTMAANYASSYGNVLYTSGAATQNCYYKNGSNNFETAIYYSPTTVVLFDGKNPAKIPVMIGYRHASSSTKDRNAYGAIICNSTSDNDTENAAIHLADNWKGNYTNTANLSTLPSFYTNGTTLLGGHSGLAYSSSSIGGASYKQKAVWWTNSIQVYSVENGSQDFVPVWHTYGDSNTSLTSYDSNMSFVLTTSNHIYAINYKPIADKYDAVKAMYNTVKSNESLYCKDKLDAFYAAAYEVLSLDPNDYFSGINENSVNGAVQNCVDAINHAESVLTLATTGPATHNYTSAITTPATCVAKGVETFTCTNCGDEYTQDIDPKGEHDYAKTTDGYVTTYTCKYGCGDSYTVDKTALASAITVAQAEMSQSFYEGKYTSASRNAFETALEKAIAARDDDEVTDEDTIDAKAAAIAIGNLKVAKYSVSVNVVYEDDKYGAGVSISGDGSYEYGETAGLYANINQITEGRYSGADEYIIYKWVKTVNGQDIKLGTNAKNVYDVVTDSATYTCYVLKYDASSDDGTEKARVRYLDKSNNTIGIDYAEIGSVVSPSCEYPEIPFYDFAGWECVYGDPENVGSQEVVFKATYTYSKVESNKCQIVGLNGVNVEGKTTYEAYYDELVTLTGSETGYAYADENGVIISAITGDQIYAPHNNKTIYIIALTVEEAEKANTLITGHIMNANKLTLNVQSYVPEGATLVETGIVASKKVADPAIGVTGCSSIAAQNVGSKGEFSMTMGFTLTGDTVHFKSYVIYRDSDNELHTAYSDVYDVVLA